MLDAQAHPLEIVPDGEAHAIEHVCALQAAMMKARDPRKRGQHPKHQALLRGHFEINDKIPENLRAGLFFAPGRFNALVRVSTGPMPRDCDPNPHALAIKLLGVPGSPSGTQDFIMLDQPTFFIRDVREYVKFFDAAITDPRATTYFRCRPREFGLSQSFNIVIANQLERQYWSEVPIAMGTGAARLTVIPDVGNTAERGPATTPDGLRDALEDLLITQKRTVKFAFGAQAYVDEATTPIEDATSVWPTPFELIATLTLPAQDFTSPAQYALGERLSYTPWHAVPAHQPLGGIQRCRKRVYEESQRLRHDLTATEDREPSAEDWNALGAFL